MRRCIDSRRTRTLSRRRRGVSEIVATILLLGMTILLFTSVFYLVNHFPTPPPQPEDQFSAALSYGGSGGTQVTAVSITHLSGPTIYGSLLSQAAIYLSSQAHPTAFSGHSPFTIAQGLASGGTNWAFGQIWTLSLTSYSLTAPDNITVSVIASGVLLFRDVLYASPQAARPYFTVTTITPTGVTHGSGSFELYVNASVVFLTTSGDSVSLNLSEVGISGAVAMTGSGASGTYTYSGAATAPTTAGTYYIFLTAKDSAGRTTTTAVALSAS